MPRAYRLRGTEHLSSYILIGGQTPGGQMAAQFPTPRLDLRSNHDKMRALFEKFARASGEEKKQVAREMLVLLPVRR
jgi:hypothetical protein